MRANLAEVIVSSRCRWGGYRMRVLRLLMVGLVAFTALGSGLSVTTVSGAPPADARRAPAGHSATIQVTVEGDQYDDNGDPASAGSGCSFREALALLYHHVLNHRSGPPHFPLTNPPPNIPPAHSLPTP